MHCFSVMGSRRRALSKLRLSHCVVDAALQAYDYRGLPVPPVTRPARGVSTSWAVLKGVPLMDICSAATWASPRMFTRFYQRNVAAPHQTMMAVLSASLTCN